MKKEPMMVTVFCAAYNHEKYIRDTLDGFVAQKTNFPFEVIVHDDASTDNTAKIIKEYADKYPKIIKAIFQTENQYTRGGRISDRFVLPIAHGKYYALCEGDDYWIDENKLQMQVDFLESHPEYSACVHNTKVLNCQNNKEEGIKPKENWTEPNDTEVSFETLIDWENCNRFHTSSVVCKMELRKSRPPETVCGSVGDYPFSLYLCSKGKIHRIPQVMSVYRSFSESSWSANVSRKKVISDNEKIINMLRYFDDATEKKYNDCIVKRIMEISLRNAELEGNYKYIKRDLKALYESKPLKYKLKIFILEYFPWLMTIKRKILKKGNALQD